MTVLIFDTSTLRETPKTALTSIEYLCRFGAMNVLMPEIVLREFSTGSAEDTVIQGSVRKYLRRASSWLDENRAEQLSKSLKLVENFAKEGHSLVEYGIRDWLGKVGGKVEPMSLSNTNNILNRYFLGSPPFSGKKSREDLPDAFIFDAVQRAAQQNQVIFLVNDDRLKRACNDLENVSVFPSLHAFHQSSEFRYLQHLAEEQQAKEELLEEVYKIRAPTLRDHLDQIVGTLSKQNSEIVKMMETQLLEELEGTIYYESFSGVEAEIFQVVQIYDIDFKWKSSLLITPNLVSVPITATANASIESLVSRQELMHLPDSIRNHYSTTEFDWDDRFFWLKRDVEITAKGATDLRFIEHDDGTVYFESLENLIIEEIEDT